MTRDQVTAERVAGLERWLEVYRGADREVTERGEREGLAGDVGRKGVVEELDGGQAAALHADAVADAKVARPKAIERNHHVGVTTAILAGPHLTNVLHNSSKQTQPSEPLSPRPQPQPQIILESLHASDSKPQRLLQISELGQ